MAGFTSEELAVAKNVDLVDLAAYLGYTPKRTGATYSLKEIDSLHIYNRRTWSRFSRIYEGGGGGEKKGGSTIDFLAAFAGITDIKDGVAWLLNYCGYDRVNPNVSMVQEAKQNYDKSYNTEKIPFVLPQKAKSYRYLYAYLIKKRGLSKETVDFFVKNHYIYESEPYHNVVFLGKDATGTVRFASMRGTYDRDGKGFKGDVAGNDKNYGFNVVRPGSTEVAVFEAAIDSMSYLDMSQDTDKHLLALGMLADHPLSTFLSEHLEVKKIHFALDNDEPGRNAVKGLMEKYSKLGYEVVDMAPDSRYKDFNEQLQAVRKEAAKSIKAHKVL